MSGIPEGEKGEGDEKEGSNGSSQERSVGKLLCSSFSLIIILDIFLQNLKRVKKACLGKLLEMMTLWFTLRIGQLLLAMNQCLVIEIMVIKVILLRKSVRRRKLPLNVVVLCFILVKMRKRMKHMMRNTRRTTGRPVGPGRVARRTDIILKYN